VSAAALICPGRGSYSERSLGSLPAGHPLLQRADELRKDYGLIPLSQLDSAGRFSHATHLRPANAAPLIWLVSMVDAAAVLAREECTCVAGNSMGWYTALAVAGALEFEDGFRLVQEMALLQEEHAGGGQVIYPVVREDWRADPERQAAVDGALASAPGEAFPSIALGGYAVLAGTDAGVEHLLRSLPPLQVGANRYPLRLVQHGPYHTPLLAGVAASARERLSDLRWQRPRFTLVDGRGARSTPWSADVAALRDYTLGQQVTEPFDLTLCLRIVLREHAPDELVLLGPGNTLGAVCGQVLAREGWRGVHTKQDFERVQAAEGAPVRSLRR
jgi:malonyl CoA-acyl carrier protein transacylase